MRAAHRLQFQDLLDGLVAEAKLRLNTGRRLLLALQCGADDWILEEFQAVVLGFSASDIPATLDSTVTAKIWQARAQVSTHRLSLLAQVHSKFGSIGMSPTVICQHIRLPFATVLSQTARKNFKSTIVQDRNYVRDCVDCRTSADIIGRGNYPPVDGEEKIVRQLWTGVHIGEIPASWLTDGNCHTRI